MLKVIKTAIFQKWFDSLKNKTLKAIIRDKMQRMEIDGYMGKTYAIVGHKNISEIKIEMGAGYRIYFNIYIKDNEIWLLNGGDKSTQTKDIAMAQALLNEIEKKRNKDNGKSNDNTRRR